VVGGHGGRVTKSSSRATLGIVLMTLAMLTVPLVDGLAKHLSGSYSPLYLAWARYAVASLIVLPFAAIAHGPSVFPVEQRGLHLVRTVCLVIAMTLYFVAIAQIPLATAISAFFVGPIVAVALSLTLLKERVTRGKIVSLALGFAGSLVILRPGATIEAGILPALGSGLFFALYLVATRQAAQASDPLKTLVFQSVVGTLLLTPQAVANWSIPALNDLWLFAALGALSAISHILSIAAFRHADASTLAPLVYVELIGAAVVGYLAFNEVPGAATLLGAALIVAGGFVLLDRRQRTRVKTVRR
jgi:drug/metabolite transporter (DMT)-like permease